MLNLNGLAVGEKGRVKYAAGSLKKRLYDLGFTAGAEVECLLAAPGRGMRAYRVRRAVIALRRHDAAQVWMEDKRHE